jgi:hypothetical protein
MSPIVVRSGHGRSPAQITDVTPVQRPIKSCVIPSAYDELAVAWSRLGSAARVERETARRAQYLLNGRFEK